MPEAPETAIRTQTLVDKIDQAFSAASNVYNDDLAAFELEVDATGDTLSVRFLSANARIHWKSARVPGFGHSNFETLPRGLCACATVAADGGGM